MPWVNVGEYRFFVLIVKPSPEMLSSNAIFWILYAVEFCALLFAFCTVPKLVRALGKTPLYHRNLIRITQAYFLISYAGIASRVIIILFQVNLLDIEANSVHAGLLVVAAIVRLLFTNFLGFFLPSIVVERLFASRYIVDYEKVSRSWISVMILVITISLSLFYSVTTVLGCHRVTSISSLSLIIHIVCVILYVYLFRRDCSKLRTINREACRKKISYTLSIKFQLKENIRVLKTLLYLSIVIAASAVIICLLLYSSMSVFPTLSVESQICSALMYLSFAVCYDIIIAIFMANVGMFRSGIIFLRCRVKERANFSSDEEHQQLTQLYFNNLKNSWDKTAANLKK
ncbi:hypothetical protein KIN20_003691 [Parelaphostrongylus tenuis]|uniref:Uncharacterized protein n=1 Tax=Parelaphostrongylus tenuis TaxID=148309 RepID=A0AAD5MG04_PARTN|nr:hypothetical protein KIN20_003691 [Parelaphostrongylus tenuis]